MYLKEGKETILSLLLLDKSAPRQPVTSLCCLPWLLMTQKSDIHWTVITQCLESNIYLIFKFKIHSSYPQVKNSRNQIMTWSGINTKQTRYLKTVQDKSFNSFYKTARDCANSFTSKELYRRVKKLNYIYIRNCLRKSYLNLYIQSPTVLRKKINYDLYKSKNDKIYYLRGKGFH